MLGTEVKRMAPTVVAGDKVSVVIIERKFGLTTIWGNTIMSPMFLLSYLMYLWLIQIDMFSRELHIQVRRPESDRLESLW